MKLPEQDQLEHLIRGAIAARDWPAVQRWADQLDRIEKPRRTLAGAALWYGLRGLAVFPLQPGGKRPYQGSHGLKDASTDLDQIRAWWTARPTSNIGLATGLVVDVIDIDGPAGVLSWSRLLLTQADDLDPLGTVSTPRPGGTHLYVPATGNGNRAGTFPGIDYRGQGGYVVAPPSTNSHGQPYYWRRPLSLP